MEVVGSRTTAISTARPAGNIYQETLWLAESADPAAVEAALLRMLAAQRADRGPGAGWIPSRST